MLYFFLCVFVHVIAVNVSMDILKSSNSYSVQIKLSCNTIYDNTKSRNVLTELRTSSKILYGVTGSCSEVTLIYYLFPSEEYTVELKSKLANGHMCTVKEPILFPVLAKVMIFWTCIIMLMIIAFLVVSFIKKTTCLL